MEGHVNMWRQTMYKSEVVLWTMVALVQQAMVPLVCCSKQGPVDLWVSGCFQEMRVRAPSRQCKCKYKSRLALYHMDVHINFAWCKKPPDFKPPLASFESKKVIIEVWFDMLSNLIRIMCWIDRATASLLYSSGWSGTLSVFFHSASLPLGTHTRSTF